MQEIIKVENMTKDYGHGKGIFGINIAVNKGEVFGFLGPNGAGKTTTIRNLLGFIRPDNGYCYIQGMDCFKEAAQIQKSLGYLAGELAFLDDLNGKQLMEFIAAMKGLKDKRRMEALMKRFELEPRGRIKKMSKGMKQKIGIICAFMTDPDIIILDEPTSGLDPLMQNRFIELIIEEKKRGKTIFMSSHIFEEVERTCDRTAIIREGRIAAIEDMASLNTKRTKSFIIKFATPEAAKDFQREAYNITEVKDNHVSVAIQGEAGELILTLAKYPVRDMDIKVHTLEEVFLQYYGDEGKSK